MRAGIAPSGSSHQPSFLSNDARPANGVDVDAAGASSASRAPMPVWSIWRECSLSWQYTHSRSQLLPSGGLSSRRVALGSQQLP